MIGTAERMGQRSHQQCDRSTLENDRRQMDSRQTGNSSGPDTIPPVPLEGARIDREIFKTSANLEPLWDAQVATQSRTTKGHRHFQFVAECDMKNASG